MRVLTRLIRLQIGMEGGFQRARFKPLGSIKGGEYIDQISDCKLVKQDCTPYVVTLTKCGISIKALSVLSRSEAKGSSRSAGRRRLPVLDRGEAVRPPEESIQAPSTRY